jgi:hypothetical protein
MSKTLTALVVFVGSIAPAASAEAAAPTTVGVLGDSYSDEYQFYEPDRSTGRNWVEILAATRGFDFGEFRTATREEPRREGYEYNWARSDATTDDLLASGQHTGLASQVASGAVSTVVIFIGGNDFIHALESSEPLLGLARVLPRALVNYRIALETILDASPGVRVVAVTVPDIRELPMFQEDSRSGRLTREVLDAYSTALKEYNKQIRNLARVRERVAVADFDMMAKVGNRLNKRYAYIAGRRLERLRGENDLDHLFLADQRHLGTIGQGLMAQLIVNAMNVRFSAGVPPLTDREIAGYAQSVASLERSRDDLAKLGGRASSAIRRQGPSAP